MRAIRARYNPYLQSKDRIEQLKRLGHDTDKIEFIVMGGTFMSLDKQYRDFFIRNLHDSLSGHSSSSVEEAIVYSEQSKTKCIAITLETRPDYCLKPHLNDMLEYWRLECRASLKTSLVTQTEDILYNLSHRVSNLQRTVDSR